MLITFKDKYRTSYKPIKVKRSDPLHIKKYGSPADLFLVAAFLVSGCSGFQRVGKLRPQLIHEPKLTVRDLEENRDDYTIYYAGLSRDNPAAVMFDPTNDDRVLVGDAWTKIVVQHLLN